MNDHAPIARMLARAALRPGKDTTQRDLDAALEEVRASVSGRQSLTSIFSGPHQDVLLGRTIAGVRSGGSYTRRSPIWRRCSADGSCGSRKVDHLGIASGIVIVLPLRIRRRLSQASGGRGSRGSVERTAQLLAVTLR